MRSHRQLCERDAVARFGPHAGICAELRARRAYPTFGDPSPRVVREIAWPVGGLGL